MWNVEKNLYICCLMCVITRALVSAQTHYNYNQEPEIIKIIKERTSLMSQILGLRGIIQDLDKEEPEVYNIKLLLLPSLIDLNVNPLGEFDGWYDVYSKYSVNGSRYPLPDRIRLSKIMIRESVKLPDLLRRVHSYLFDRGIVKLTERYLKYLDPYCERSQSRQRYFYDFFLSVLSHEIKGFLFLRWANDMLREFEHDSLREIKETRDLVVGRINATVVVFKEIMTRMEQNMWRCDPSEHVENKTYVELKNVFQRVFYDAIDFTDDQGGMLCKKYTCPLLQTESKCRTKRCNLVQRHCNNVVGCTELDSEAFDICVSKEQDHGRRYNYVREHDPSYFSSYKEKNCTGDFRSVKHVAQLFGVFQCNSCNCICDEPKESDRYFSLKPVMSDMKNNFVITGAQFVLKNHTIYVKIQQGKLQPYGFVNKKSVAWKDVEMASDSVVQPDIRDIYSQNKEKVIYLKSNSHLPNFYTFEGREKFRLDWYNRRGLYLDEMEFDKNKVVTGIRFAVDQRATDVHVKLDIQATPFNFTSGKLIPERSYWWSTVTATPERAELKLDECDSPLKLMNVTNEPDVTPYQHTKFTPSAFLSNDAGQTTLPLIDIQPVVSDPPVPLTGISMEIKRAFKSGGYLSLKAKTYNVLWNLDDTIRDIERFIAK